jgi:hypothetical protein
MDVIAGVVVVLFLLAVLAACVGLGLRVWKANAPKVPPPLMGGAVREAVLPWFDLARDMAECVGRVLAWDRDISVSLKPEDRAEAEQLVKRYKALLGGKGER